MLRRFLSCPWGVCAQTFNCSCKAGWGNRMTATLERTKLTCCLLCPAPGELFSQAWLCATRRRGQWWPRQCTQDHAPDHAKHGPWAGTLFVMSLHHAGSLMRPFAGHWGLGGDQDSHATPFRVEVTGTH